MTNDLNAEIGCLREELRVVREDRDARIAVLTKTAEEKAFTAQEIIRLRDEEAARLRKALETVIGNNLIDRGLAEAQDALKGSAKGEELK